MAILPPHFFSPPSLSLSLILSALKSITMTSSFNQLKPPTKAVCIFSSLILTLCASVALVVFGGAIRLASDRWGDVSDIVVGKGGGGIIGHIEFGILSNRDHDIEETSVPLGSPSQSDVMSFTLSPTTNYLRSMMAYPTTASITMSPLPATTVPTNVAVIDDLHQVGTGQPSYLPSGPITLPHSVAIKEETFESPSEQPTLTPLFPVHRDPLIASQTFFNYNTTSQFGPSSWGNVIVLNSTSENYWSEFGLVTNQCQDKKVMQSPIDVCTAPEEQCLEYHEPRAKVRINSIFFCNAST